jgi:hypothetical protein
MEAFETFVALALETEGLVVSEAVKFDIARQTSSGYQTHGYEVDLLGARRDHLVLASVKSYFGSKGVNADHVAGISKTATYNKRYALLNDLTIRDRVVEMAADDTAMSWTRSSFASTSASSPAGRVHTTPA